MRLTHRDADTLVYSARGEMRRLGNALAVTGLVFGLLPVPLYLASRQPAVIMLAVPGLALLLAALWALTYRRSVTLDQARSRLRVSAGSLFGRSREEIPFERVLEIGVLPSCIEFRLDDGGRVELPDDTFAGDEERMRRQAAELAEFCGVKVGSPESGSETRTSA